MRGTGSHDFVGEGIAIPEGYGFDIFNGRGRIDRPLYRLPFPTWFGSGVAALTLGIARRAVAALVELAARKVPTASQAPLNERPLAQIQIAQAEAIVLSARAFLREAVREAWASLVAGGDPTAAELTRLRLAGVHAGEAAVRAVELMYQAAGSSAAYSSSPLDRCLRDVHVAVQHISVSTQHYQDIGRALFSQGPPVD
jgi:alkylation response protein AidB-like acyl-CoA dehydrogenase